MKKQFYLALMALLCMCGVQAQRFQVTTGNTLTNDYWGMVEDTVSGRYVVIGNISTTTPFRQGWLTSYNANGVQLSSARLFNNRQLIARDISLAPPESNGGRTYYITGWAQITLPTGLNVNQMFIGRVRINGTFVWYMENPVGGNGDDKEGVAIVQAPNGDAVAVGNMKQPVTANIPAGNRILLTRISAAGVLLWSNVYNQNFNWMAREIANGAPAPNCAASPTSMPGEFIVTGEVSIANGTTGGVRQTTFASVYNGGGVECWRMLYPAAVSSLGIRGDAGYDVVYNAQKGNYVIAGVAEMGVPRASVTSTPYLVEVTTSGVLVTSAVYTGPNNTPMGMYPRCIALGRSVPGAIGNELTIAGPDYVGNRTFMARIPAVGAGGAFVRYNGWATANSVAQPFILNDGVPEAIMTPVKTTKPGYLISTNVLPAGPFGNGDAHLIRTDAAMQTPDSCPANPIDNIPIQINTFTQSSSSPIALQQWGNVVADGKTYIVSQVFCKDTCVVTAAFQFVVNGATVSFTGTGSGNGSISYLWNFGDATTSTLQNPIHTYAASGVYNVCLTVFNVNAAGDTCKAQSCQQIQVTVPVRCDIKASATYSVSCKYKVTFTSTSTGTGPFTYQWQFLDDTTISTLPNPVKTFTTCGVHIVKLIVCNAVCCDTLVIDVIIPCCSAKSDFCLQDSGTLVKLIYNTAMNPSPTTYSVYVDNVLTAWTANTFKALTVGIHTICLKATRASCPGDTCCATCCKTIYVSAPCTVLADFWYLVQTTGTVVFYNKTTPGGSTSVWDFGDGSPLNTSASPTHVYAVPGTYTACLTSTFVNGADTCQSRICKTFTIDVPCKVFAKYKSTYCIATPLTVQFTNYSSGATSYAWDFGDGGTSVATDPVHNYANAGSYIVCLTAYASANCWSRSCYRKIVSTSSCDTSCTQLPAPPIYQTGPGSKIVKDNMILESSISVNNGVITDNTQAMRKADEGVRGKDKLSLFPNPASHNVQVLFESANATASEVTVMNALGSVVYKKAFTFAEGKNQFNVPLTGLANGNYFLKVGSGNKIQSTMFEVRK